MCRFCAAKYIIFLNEGSARGTDRHRGEIAKTLMIAFVHRRRLCFYLVSLYAIPISLMRFYLLALVAGNRIPLQERGKHLDGKIVQMGNVDQAANYVMKSSRFTA